MDFPSISAETEICCPIGRPRQSVGLGSANRYLSHQHSLQVQDTGLSYLAVLCDSLSLAASLKLFHSTGSRTGWAFAGAPEHQSISGVSRLNGDILLKNQTVMMAKTANAIPKRWEYG
jgi:hypothetical protein